MPTASVPNTFVNETAADAAEVNANFAALVSFLNTYAIQKDASVAFTSVPSGPASDPTTDNQLARKKYVDDSLEAAVPAGFIGYYVGTTPPSGWLELDGSTVTNAQTLYPSLWSAAPAGWKSGANLTLPDATGRFIYGGDAGTPGATGGASSVTLATANLPSHTHGAGSYAAASGGAHTHAGPAGFDYITEGLGSYLGSSGGALASATASGGAHTHDITGTSSATGSGSSFSILPPYMRFLICVRAY